MTETLKEISMICKCGSEMIRLNPENGSFGGLADWRPIHRCERRSCQRFVISLYRPKWKLDQEQAFQTSLQQNLSVKLETEPGSPKQSATVNTNPIIA